MWLRPALSGKSANVSRLRKATTSKGSHAQALFVATTIRFDCADALHGTGTGPCSAERVLRLMLECG
jgi:hypothetical protein